MYADCSPPPAGVPEIPALPGLLDQSRLSALPGTVSLAADRPGHFRLVFEGGDGARRVWVYGAPFDSGLLHDTRRRRELARLTKAFVAEANAALKAKPRMPFRLGDC